MNLTRKFGNLGYDLVDLDSLIYVGLDPNPTTDCDGVACYGGCTPSCYTCKNGGSSPK